MTDTRMIGRMELPPAGTWSIDPGNAEVAFVTRQFGLSKVRGRFTRIEGTVRVAADTPEPTVDVTIDMASVDTGSARRDKHLRSSDFFDVANYSTAHFRSTAIAVDGTHGTITGDLTIKGVTQPVTLDFEYLGYAADPGGKDHAAFSATATLNRTNWGVVWNMARDTGGLLASKHVTLQIDVELIRQGSSGPSVDRTATGANRAPMTTEEDG